MDFRSLSVLRVRQSAFHRIGFSAARMRSGELVDAVDGGHVQCAFGMVPFGQIPVFPMGIQRDVLASQHHHLVA